MEFFSVKLVYRSFPIFDVILISYRECWTGMSIHFPSVWIFYFYFFPSLQTTSFVFPISNNSTRIITRDRRKLSRSWKRDTWHPNLPQRETLQKKVPRQGCEGCCCLEMRIFKACSRPAFRFYHFPAHVRRNKRNPGNLFRRPCRFFPHPPSPIAWYTTTRRTQLFPVGKHYNLSILAPDRDLSGLPCSI